MKTFAMSNHFNPMEGFDRPQDFHEQARILKDVGIDGYYYNMGREVTNEKIRQCVNDCKEEGVELAAMYWVADINNTNLDAELDLFRGFLADIPDGCPVEFGLMDGTGELKASSEEALDLVARYITAILPDLQSKSCLLCPYPHFNFLLETVADSLDLIEKCGGTGMRAVASAIHGHIAREDWASQIEQAPNAFQSVSLCGISKPGIFKGYKIEPLGTGEEVDNGARVKALQAAGYDGWLGLQGYSVEAHSKDLLTESAKVLKSYLDN